MCSCYNLHRLPYYTDHIITGLSWGWFIISPVRCASCVVSLFAIHIPQRIVPSLCVVGSQLGSLSVSKLVQLLLGRLYLNMHALCVCVCGCMRTCVCVG